MNTKDKSKHAKYTTGNPVSHYLVSKFFNSLGMFYSKISVDSILDVGCGEGMVLNHLNNQNKIDTCFAIDFDENEVIDAKTNIPFCKVSVGSIYDIPYSDNFVDLVICSEVLEHLNNPEIGLKQLHAVTKKYALLSVPREPIWRILNMARFKYWNKLGNTPDHLNHWSKRSFKRFVSEYFEIIDTKLPLPWIILLCVKK
jgi:ubiquinone/menaquinone biosynthesis C-methylase UbiE